MALAANVGEYMVPRQNKAVELLWRFRVILKLLTAVIFAALMMFFLTWLVEYFVWKTDFLTWFTARWPIGITVMLSLLGITLWFLSKKSLDRTEVLQYSSNVGDQLDYASNHEFITGGIKVDNIVVGPLTVSVGSDSVRLWKAGKPVAKFPWSKFQTWRIASIPGGGHCAHMKFVRQGDCGPKQLIIPWLDSMTNSVPSKLRRNNQDIH